jgi:hypothetical protein
MMSKYLKHPEVVKALHVKAGTAGMRYGPRDRDDLRSVLTFPCVSMCRSGECVGYMKKYTRAAVFSGSRQMSVLLRVHGCHQPVR